MKSVLISIYPKWCELIASGKKTVEVRKTRPKLETPFKCYIYETKAYDTLFGKGKPKKLCVGGGRVIGEFVCDKIEEYQAEFCDFEYEDCTSKGCALNSIKRVIGYDYDLPKFVFETSNEEEPPDSCELVKNSGVTFNEIRKYIGETFYDKSFYGWHISNLVIYDKPRELSEFHYASVLHTNCFGKHTKRLTRPPQSWCYVEVWE